MEKKNLDWENIGFAYHHGYALCGKLQKWRLG